MASVKTAKKIPKINQDTIFKEILEIEGANTILFKHNVPCLSCPMATFRLKI